MKYIIDTHTLIWWLSDHKKLSKKVREIISDASNIILVSVASVWEMAIKIRLGKLQVPDNLLELIESEQIQILEIGANPAWQVKNLPEHHQDPFDRLIISQAKTINAPVITKDQAFKKYGIEVIW